MCINGHTIEVSSNAVPGLLNAGATMGSCDDPVEVVEKTTSKKKAKS